MNSPLPLRAPETPRERLIEAAVAEIERHGLSQLTVRGVAAAAEMNIAAVNYHFRSKQALVDAALESSITHMLEDTDALLARLPDDPERGLADLLAYYLEGCLRYPRISKAHLHSAFVADDYSGAFPTRFAPVLGQLRDALCAALPGLTAEAAAERAMAAFSAIFFPAFFAPLYQSLRALDSPEQRAHYAREVARQAFTAVVSDEPKRPAGRAPSGQQKAESGKKRK